MDLSMVFDAILVILATAGLGILNKYYSSVMESKRLLDAQMLARNLVEAAQQMLDDNGEKLEWVTQTIENRYPELPDGVIRGLIESAVFSMNQWIKDVDSASGS